MQGPWALAADGTAKDPKAFQQALRQDPEKMAELEKVPWPSILASSDYIYAVSMHGKSMLQSGCWALSSLESSAGHRLTCELLPSPRTLNWQQCCWETTQQPCRTC